VLTRGELFDALWAPHGGATENVVDVYLGYLRRKLGNFDEYGLALRTLRGRGFQLAAKEVE
jgi:two-component system OmpR family response regulator